MSVNVPKTRNTYCKGKTCRKHTPHKVTQYKTGKASLFAQGKRRYDRKQSGYGGQTKPVFHKKAKTTRKIVLRLECTACKYKHQIALKRCKHFELGGDKKQREGTCDPYVVCRIDNRTKDERRTTTVWNSAAPFWAEEFAFDDVQRFRELNVIVWNDNKQGPPQPLGKVVFPRRYLHGEDEQWYNVSETADNDGTVSGDLRVRIKYYPAKEEGAASAFAVRVVAARGLATDDSSETFVVLHLLPDPQAQTTQQTRLQPASADPVFGETFIFTVPMLEPDQEMHFSIWNNSKTSMEQGMFLGHCSVPLTEVVMNGRLDRWFSLLPQPALADLSLDRKGMSCDIDLVILGGKAYAGGFTAKGRKKSVVEEERRNRPRAFVRALQTMPEDGAPQTRKKHKFEESKAAFATCAHCSTVMISSHLRCGECKVACHHKCQNFIVPYCGGVGVIRLRFKYVELLVLRMRYYKPLLDLLERENYAVLNILGKVSQEREDAARSLVRIFEARGTLMQFLKRIIGNEIARAEDARTLFRANSMASKSLDLFMKYVGSNYLERVLLSVIKAIVDSNRPCELDPARMEKDADLTRNTNSLILYNTLITDAIFKSTADFPPRLREIFHFMQEEVSKRFPSDELVRYTAVSGFIFLRFFAPAILGPKLFGLEPEAALDARATRTLTLSAKVLQSLANLVEFGQKESFMAPMNPFILSRIDDMKKFINEISTTTNTGEEQVHVDPPNIQLEEKECSEMYGYLSRAIEKMLSTDGISEKDRKLIEEVSDALSEISGALEQVQRDASQTESPLLDEPVEEIEDFGDEDRRIDALLSGTPLNLRSQRTSFRNSFELQQELSKSRVMIPQSVQEMPIHEQAASLGVGGGKRMLLEQADVARRGASLEVMDKSREAVPMKQPAGKDGILRVKSSGRPRESPPSPRSPLTGGFRHRVSTSDSDEVA
ncbi:hypothetical protein HK104_010810, partial [Borealophlyctis nickersoniae]